MTNKITTKRALLISLVSMLLCFAMLLGTTFAWFTDSASSGNNIIKTGNLDMKLSYKPYGAENTEWTEVTESTVLFGKDALYEPGYTEAVWLKVENLGSLAFRYDLAINVANETQGTNMAGEKFSLSDHLEVKYMTTTSTDMESNFYTTRESLDSFAWGSAANSGVASLSDDIAVIQNGVVFSASDATNGAYSSAYVLVVISMPTTVGNEANHDGKDIPQIDFTLTALATQLAYEEDSFGDQYDGNAEYDVNNVYIGNVKYDTIAAAIDAAKDGDTIRLTAGTFYEALNLQGKALTIQGAGKASTIIAGPEDYTTANIPMQTWAGWSGQDANVYALISANKDVTIKDLTVNGDPTQIGEVAEFRHEGANAFVGIHVQSANATIENVNIKNIKPTNVTGNDHHNFGLYITSAIDDTNTYAATYKNGTVSDVNRGGIYCWSPNYTLSFENVTVVGPGSPENPNGTLTPAVGSENNNAIYAFAPFYIDSASTATYNNVVIRDSWCVDWWGGASWNWANPAWATNPPEGVTCINCGTQN